MKKFVSALVILLSIFLHAGVAVSGNADLEQGLVGSFRSSLEVIEKAEKKLSQGLSIKAEITLLQLEAEGIRASNLLLEERFRVRGQKARELGGKARQRQEEMETRYRDVLGQLQSLLDELAEEGSTSSATLKSLQELFEQAVPEKKNPILGSLPYSHLNYPAREPVAAPLVVPAYRGGGTAVTADDTRGTAAAPITPEIAELAKTLDWNPVRIYEWVRENIEAEWYWGSMKGARETLRQRSGNDADQASLLIALLRSAGFPARYVRGVTEFFPGIEKAKSLTGLDDPLKIAVFFQKAGIPFEPVIVGGTIANFRMEHIWVETEVPYANYRGSLLDNMGKTWVALDTHLKPSGYRWNAAEDFGSDFDLAALSGGYLSQPRIETPLEYLRGAFRQYLEGRFASTTYQDHLRTRFLDFSPLGILPASLQFQSTAITGEYVELPANLRHQVAFAAATADGSELFSITFDAASLSNRSVSLSYEPETVEDQQIIDSHGGLDNTPSYLVRLRPMLKIDDERKVVGRDGLPMGADYNLTIGLISPNGRQDVVSRHVVGNLSSLGIVSQKVVQPEELALEEKDAERLLHESALSYIDRWNTAEEELSSFLKVIIARPLPTVVTVGGVIDVAYLFGEPQGFDWKGVFIDAGFRRIETVAAPAQEERAREFMRLSALEGSILENRVFEDDLGVASISTAKLLALAPQNPVTLLTLDGSNVDAMLPTLSLPENVEADIRNAVHQGFTITLPEAELSYRNWTGIGYIKENPATGEAGYMLTGMIAGGMTAEEWADQVLRERFENAYSEPPNEDPGAAARIIMIPVGDRQNGTVGQEVEEPLAVLVVDLEGRPVVGAEVTFTALAGGAHFDGEATAQVTTGGNGIAKVSPALGTITKDNPSYLRTNQGDAYATQVGVNLFSATVTGQYGTLSLPKPFEVYGQPDVPVGMAKVVGDGNWSMANNSAGTLKVRVVDQYQNPVSNVPVTFQAESASSMSSVTALPPNYRSVTFYDNNECTNEYPLYGECPSSTSITRRSAHHGVGVNAFLGNTVNTRYEVSANASGVPAETFTLHSGGYWEEGGYLPPQLFVDHLTRINDQGEEVNAAKAGEQLKAPLTATMVIMTSDYTMEGPTTCTKYDSKGESYQTDCWSIKGSGLVSTERINDGTVQFTPVSGGGSVAPVENLGEGSYQTSYTTGSIPSLNQIEAVGEATVTVPQVYGTYYEIPIETGYTDDTLPKRTVTLKSGQKGLFKRSTKELLSQSPGKIGYEVYGVDVTTEVSPKVLFLGEGNMSRDDLTVSYTVLPDDEPPAGYEALGAQVDLSSVGLSDGTQWEGYLVGSAVKGTGTAVFSYGKEFDPQKNYHVQPVLNRGGDIEIKGDKVALKIVSVDVDIDSDNNAGFKPDGTHNDPQRDPLEDQVEDLAGAPGKLIQPNMLDVDGDKVPGFADGIDMHGNEGEGASAPFVPLLLEIDGNIDPAKARIRLVYSASDPAGVAKETDAEGRDIYTPAEGHLRLWTKDGGQSRKVASLKAGGDFIKPGELYALADLGQKTEKGDWRLRVEGIKDTATPEVGQIRIEIDLDGTGQTYYVGDIVQTIVRSVTLVPDYNHDRVIDEEDRKRALAGDTYYFWINDDDDEGDLEGEDTPGKVTDPKILEKIFSGQLPTWSNKLDYQNDRVDGTRDLEDFFPVLLHIKDLVEIFPPRRYKYDFVMRRGGVNFAESSLTPEASGRYLTDVDFAKSMESVKVRSVDERGIFNTPEGIDPDTWIDNVLQNDKRVLLFEGAKANIDPSGQNKPEPLKLIVYDRDTLAQVIAIDLNLSLSGVEQFFRHKNLIEPLLAHYQANGGVEPDSPPSSALGKPDRLKPEDFVSEYIEYSTHFAGFDAEHSQGDFVFVHGYNVNGEEARGAQSEMFKRLYWSGSKARLWGITWFGWDSQSNAWQWLCAGRRSVNYHINVRHAYYTGKLLTNFTSGNSLGNATFAAHSLGNMVMSAAVEQGLAYRQYFMVNAAVAEEAYVPRNAYDDGAPWESATGKLMFHPDWRYPNGDSNETGYLPYLWSSEWYKQFADESDLRHGLTWRDYFGKVRSQQGTRNTYSFYAPTDEAFRPFTLPVLEQYGELADYPANISQKPGLGAVWDNVSCQDIPRVGTYSWSFQELLKGKEGMEGYIDLFGTDSMYGGWGFNETSDDGYVEIKPDFGLVNQTDPARLKEKPFFSKNSKNSFLYTSDPVYADAVDDPEAKTIELLANEFPALTYAAGHRGVRGKFDELGLNIDIRENYIVDGKWPGERRPREWRHNDIYFVGYPYLYRMYDVWKGLAEGDFAP